MSLAKEVLKLYEEAMKIGLSSDTSLVEADKHMELKPLGIINKTYFIEINGRKYGYEASSQINKSIDEIVKTFQDMLKTNNRGEALAWLRSATKNVSGSVKGVSPLMR